MVYAIMVKLADLHGKCNGQLHVCMCCGGTGKRMWCVVSLTSPHHVTAIVQSQRVGSGQTRQFLFAVNVGRPISLQVQVFVANEPL